MRAAVGLLLLGVAASFGCAAPAAQEPVPADGPPEPWRPADPRFGRELQVHPAGLIGGFQVRWHPSRRDAVFARAGLHLNDRGGRGEHDDESGTGFGGGLGWRRALGEGLDEDGWHVGLRLDLWRLGIDWRDPGPRRGSTDVTVLQPAAEVGHGWVSDRLGRFELTLGLGVEVNVDTDGEDVGEGAIALLGLTWIP